MPGREGWDIQSAAQKPIAQDTNAEQVITLGLNLSSFGKTSLKRLKTSDWFIVIYHGWKLWKSGGICVWVA